MAVSQPRHEETSMRTIPTCIVLQQQTNATPDSDTVKQSFSESSAAMAPNGRMIIGVVCPISTLKRIGNLVSASADRLSHSSPKIAPVCSFRALSRPYPQARPTTSSAAASKTPGQSNLQCRFALDSSLRLCPTDALRITMQPFHLGAIARTPFSRATTVRQPAKSRPCAFPGRCHVHTGAGATVWTCVSMLS